MNLLKDLIRAYEKTVLEQYLAQNDSNRSKTAVVLGISRRGLLNKLKEHGITNDRASIAPADPEAVEAPGSSEQDALFVRPDGGELGLEDTGE
jgi:hypothetical protein